MTHRATERFWSKRVVVHLAVAATTVFFSEIAWSQDAADSPSPSAVEPEEDRVNRETTSDLPSIEELPRPTAAEILHDRPEDWLILEQIRVLRVEPVEPRPGTLAKIQARVDQFALTKPQTQDLVKLADWRVEFEKVADLEVTLIDDDLGRPYWLHKKHIDRIIHHETHALNEAARLRALEDFGTARELLDHVRRRDPNWPGLVEERNRLMFADAEVMLRDGAPEHALAVFERLYERDSEFPQLELRLSQAVRQIGMRALAADDPRQVRAIAERLRRTYPRQPVIESLNQARRDRAERYLAKASSPETSAREASELIGMSARYAPELRGLSEAHDRYFSRYPVLHVGAMRVGAAKVDPLLRTVADLRFKELTEASLFEPDSVEGDLVRFKSTFVTDWQPRALGRGAELFVETDVEGLDAYALATVLGNAVSSPDKFGDRWRSMIGSVRPISPQRLDLDLRSGPLRLDVLLGELPLELIGRFDVAGSIDRGDNPTTAGLVFQSTVPQEDRARGQFAEIVEHQYEDPEAFGRAIRRDEIALAVDVPPYLVNRLTQEPWFAKEVILSQTTVPATHLLQFRPGSPVGESRSLRVALERAIDRPFVMCESMLHVPVDAMAVTPHARLTSDIFPSFSYANDPTVSTRDFAQEAAIPQALLARRQLGERWGTMRMIAPASPEIRHAAELLVEGWRMIQLPVELVPVDETETAIGEQSWDIAYRVTSVMEPSLAMWSLLAEDGVPTLSSIDYLDEPLRQRLIRLESTRDWPTAARLLAGCHRAILEQALMIPLWEIDRLSIRRRAIRNVPDDHLLTPYYQLEQWRVEPVFSTDFD